MRRRARFIVIKCQHDRKPAISSYLKFFQLRKLAAAYRGHLAGSLVIILFPLFRIVPNIFVRGWQSSRSTRVMFRRSKIVSSRSWLVVHTRCWKKEKILNVVIDRSCEQSHPFDWNRHRERVSSFLFKWRDWFGNTLAQGYLCKVIVLKRTKFLCFHREKFKFHSEKFTLRHRSLYIYRI